MVDCGMSRYNNSKIYKITDNAYTKTYYGSTTEPLSKRMDRHRSDYKKFLNNEKHYVSSFSLFDEFGVENCKIELVEECSFSTKEELLKREGYYIKNNECLNKNVAGRTTEEYLYDNKEAILSKAKAYKDSNKEKTQQYMKEYRENKKEQIKQQRKEYRKNNKDKIQEYSRAHKEQNCQRQKERRQLNPEKSKEASHSYYEKVKGTKYKCGCGAEILERQRTKHCETLKHQKWLEQQQEK